MSFKTAVAGTPEVSAAYNSGLGALKRVDAARLTVQSPSKLTGSIDLDSTVKDLYPNANRWDYGIGFQHGTSEKIYWVEVHPATDGEISVISNKLSWLKQWLVNSAPRLNSMNREFVWVASGKTAVTPKSNKLRKLVEQGVTFKGGHFIVD